MRAGCTSWFLGLLAGLFALATLPVPAQHARALIEQASFAVAYAMPDGTLPEICHDAGGTMDASGTPMGHAMAPACLACLLMAAPGLPEPGTLLPQRAGVRMVADLHVAGDQRPAGLDWAPQRARAPPARSLA